MLDVGSCWWCNFFKGYIGRVVSEFDKEIFFIDDADTMVMNILFLLQRKEYFLVSNITVFDGRIFFIFLNRKGKIQNSS